MHRAVGRIAMDGSTHTWRARAKPHVKACLESSKRSCRVVSSLRLHASDPSCALERASETMPREDTQSASEFEGAVVQEPKRSFVVQPDGEPLEQARVLVERTGASYDDKPSRANVPVTQRETSLPDTVCVLEPAVQRVPRTRA